MKMNEYISKEAMLKNLTSDLEHHSGEGDPRTHLVMQRFIQYVEDFPPADVEPIEHGKWEDCEIRGSLSQCCSICGCDSGVLYPYRYCPNCGARMDGDAE